MTSIRTLAAFLKEAQTHHHDAESRLPAHDWADWYAVYLTLRAIEVDEKPAAVVADYAVTYSLDIDERLGDADHA